MEFLKNIFGEKALTFNDFKTAVEADNTDIPKERNITSETID